MQKEFTAMSEIFGLSMSTILVVLVAMFSLCLLSVAMIAWRRPVLFKLGVRNIPRRRAQSTLIVVGLMLSTLIISAALGVGDTLEYSASSDVYRQLGHVDEIVVKSQEFEADINSALLETIDESALHQVDTALAGNGQVDGIMPLLDVRVPVLNEAAGQVEPSAIMTGIDPSRLGQFDGLHAADGGNVDLAALTAGQVVISEEAADVLDASIGDTLTVFYNNAPVTLDVADIAADSTLAGQRETAISMVMPLAHLQEMTGQTGRLTGVVISNAGGARDSSAPTDDVIAALKPSLEGNGLGVAAIKADSVDQSQQLASVFTSLFLVLGLFSVAAGVLLIVLIFTMLAAERRSEMGMARAVGTHRRQLIQQFVAEGSAYAILSGLVGAALGVLATWGIGIGMKALFGQFLPIEPHVTLRSLVVAYCLGMVITFLAVVGSSWKVSRLNIVAAVRDIPDVTSPKRKKSGLVWGILFLVGGAFLTLQGLDAGQAFSFYAGMSLMPFGVARVLRFFGTPGRPVYTIVGSAIVALWMLPQDVANSLFGELDGDMEMFFLSGIFMVIGATIVIVHNIDFLLAGISRLGGVFRSKLPAIRTAVAYPGAAQGRTGMTIAMFSLIIFSLVMIATMNQNYVNMFLGDDANAGWDVRTDAQNANPITDFEGLLRADGVDTSGFTAVGAVTSPSPFGSEARQAGTDAWQRTTVHGMDAAFITESELVFQQRAEGYDSDEAIIAALRNEPNVAVADVSVLPAGTGAIGGGGDPLQLAGLTTEDTTFAPYPVELAKPDGGAATVMIIGIIDSKIGSLTGLYAAQPTIDAVYPNLAMSSWYVALNDADQADEVAKGIEASLMQNGAQSVSIRDELKDAQKQEAGFLYLIEGFMGLGLFVGIAAVGVIAYRSVVERRQQIGVLRALGYQRGMVSLSFLIETGFVVGMGVISGTALGLVLSRNLFTADTEDAAFSVPWPIIGTILLATMIVSLLMTWMPSRQAASIAPAEALRYE
jgi:putative ABC transport system permease protein